MQSPLTPREFTVARYVALGFTAPQIAVRLGISVATVRTLIRRGAQRLRKAGLGPTGRPMYDLLVHVLSVEEDRHRDAA
jgi:FixJ family two-component response regulator